MLSDKQRKKLFAEKFMADPMNIYAAAAHAWPDNINQGIQLAVEWSNDQEVLEQCSLLAQSGVRPGLPTREELVKELLTIGRSANDMRDRIKALELVADLLNYKPQPQTNVNVKNTIDNRVLVVPPAQMAGMADFAERAKEQQRKLIEMNADTTKH